MTAPDMLTAWRRALSLGAVFVSVVGCSAPSERGRPADLAASFATAVHRPANGAFELRTLQIDGRDRPAIAVPAASRISWRLKLPDAARLHTWMAVESTCPSMPAAAVDFRIGISDERSYDELLVRTISTTPSAAWESAAVDLAAYSGFHWSLFYRPRDIVWSVVLNTRPIGRTGPECAPRPLWGGPAIEVSR
jgi:hypothetical protein